MITLCRPAYYLAHTTPMFVGLSTDTKKDQTVTVELVENHHG